MSVFLTYLKIPFSECDLEKNKKKILIFLMTTIRWVIVAFPDLCLGLGMSLWKYVHNSLLVGYSRIPRPLPWSGNESVEICTQLSAGGL